MVYFIKSYLALGRLQRHGKSKCACLLLFTLCFFPERSIYLCSETHTSLQKVLYFYIRIYIRITSVIWITSGIMIKMLR